MTTKKRTFISFDIDRDDGAKKMLAGQAKLPDSPLDSKDNSAKEHLTGDWKKKVRLNLPQCLFSTMHVSSETHTAYTLGKSGCAEKTPHTYYSVRSVDKNSCK